MSPIGIQRTIAFVIFISPWVYVPSVFKDIIFIIMGVMLFVSTLANRRKYVSENAREHHTEASS